MRRVALYGGTFDPVHNGHIAVARALISFFAFDAVSFIPAYVAPHKRAAEVASAFHRFAMLALATQDEERFRLSTVELEAPERPYTVDTLTRLRAKFNDSTRLFFIMGADSWEEIKTWRDWEQVLTMTDHIVVARPGHTLRTDHVTPAIRARIVDLCGAKADEARRTLGASEEGRIFLTDVVTVDVSATQVRRAASEGRELRSLVPAPVAEYIRKHGLYSNRLKGE
ncbi:nicotinate-nucleotide adenylyltransferase [Pyrinomonas methylaliphatogenes]|uniref:Probable nicotinate-nucleotide adenylyltransferase n=1 Tax=Pyrinomonas methylaliphatogenes TaxID=454194 RepID=A0A0B6WZL4_9BACT|nr:nicotinate-nucleotide adenylyltransferase [Pyrinomonas methylaliphatogenes]MBX5478505.1 nicotinate (nicotinamide) nucleotide adenylyltransferase [Pyrinomonas methylaliphatogenes]CDM66147.1 nicotinate-nucleotide adenylyltransferase [Pyrinomonas methylaliphatogenes]